MNIALIGYRGTGKSTLGKHLAELLHMDFVDADTLLIERAGKSIKELFASEGESAFRDRESALLHELLALDHLIIATGGGVILRPENVIALQQRSKVVWLQADADTLHRRIRSDVATGSNRPNLTSAGGIEEIRTLLAIREPLYRAAAELSLDVAQITPEEGALQLSRLL